MQQSRAMSVIKIWQTSSKYHIVICTSIARQQVGNKFPQRQILSKQSVAKLHNNSDNRISVFNVVHVTASSKQQNCKHIYNNKCFLWGLCWRFLGDSGGHLQSHLCGSGVEYLHRDPASRKRRRKGKSQIWDSKKTVASPKGLGPKKDCTGKGQRHIQKTNPSSRQRGRPTETRT
jgi:hypothetical protein